VGTWAIAEVYRLLIASTGPGRGRSNAEAGSRWLARPELTTYLLARPSAWPRRRRVRVPSLRYGLGDGHPGHESAPRRWGRRVPQARVYAESRPGPRDRTLIYQPPPHLADAGFSIN
jgi:hypothetical protein